MTNFTKDKSEGKPTVTIGIPAYNEEANIKNLLESILSQRQDNFIIDEIIVISDGSDDRTADIVRSLNNLLINLVESKERLGQQVRQNQILKMYKGDLLVILEADTLPADNEFLVNLIKPLISGEKQNLAMTIGNIVYIPPKNFLEKIIFHGNIFKRKFFMKWKNGNNVYVGVGQCAKALSRDFASKIVWPKDAPEDSYIYLRLKELGLTFSMQLRARIYMKNVDNVNDRIKQRKKFLSGVEFLKKYFSADLLGGEYKIPKSLIFFHTIKEFSKNPFWITMYFFEFLFIRILLIFLFQKITDKTTTLYEPYMSSKKLKLPC